MSAFDDRFVIMGRFGSPYGVKGWVKLHCFTDPVDSLLNYHPCYMQDGNGTSWKEIKLTTGRAHQNGLVVHIESCDDRDKAALFTGKEIAVKREQLPDLGRDSYYWDDLIGLTVINQSRESLGVIQNIFETGANDVLVVKQDNGKEHLIPYILERVITEVNLKEKVMHVDWEIL